VHEHTAVGRGSRCLLPAGRQSTLEFDFSKPSLEQSGVMIRNFTGSGSRDKIAEKTVVLLMRCSFIIMFHDSINDL
jgi:hypothetical protein